MKTSVPMIYKRGCPTYWKDILSISVASVGQEANRNRPNETWILKKKKQDILTLQN